MRTRSRSGVAPIQLISERERSTGYGRQRHCRRRNQHGSPVSGVTVQDLPVSARRK